MTYTGTGDLVPCNPYCNTISKTEINLKVRQGKPLTNQSVKQRKQLCFAHVCAPLYLHFEVRNGKRFTKLLCKLLVVYFLKYNLVLKKYLCQKCY